MPGKQPSSARGAVRMSLLLGLGVAAMIALVVGVLAYTTNQEVTSFFDRSARDSRDIAITNLSTSADLLASNTATTVRPAVIDHNYSYIEEVLDGMTTRDPNLLYIGVFDSDGNPVEQRGSRSPSESSPLTATAAITSRGQEIGKVELLYSTTAVERRIAAAQTENHRRRAASIRSLIIAGSLVLGAGVLLAAIFGVWLTRPVRRLARAASAIGEGKFEVQVDVGGPAELRQLATTFNSMCGDLRSSMEASIEQAALEREIATARRLQREMMPPEQRIQVGELEIASWYAPAGKMGGDWWTISEYSEGKPVAIMIGDVIGHGIPAAMFTAAAKSAYTTAGICGSYSDPHRILATIDEALRGFSATHTMSCCAMQIDLASRRMVLSIGAHPAPLRFRRRDGAIEMDIMAGDGPLLGDSIPTKAGFTYSRYGLSPGDLIVLYTDGLIEATNADRRMFGLRRLGVTVTEHAEDGLEEILTALKSEFYRYVGDVEVDDDVTVVLIRYQPRDDAASS